VYGSRNFSSLGRVLASDARAAMLDLLMDGGEHPITALAHTAGVAPSTATAHVAVLAESGLVQLRPDGRQRRVCLNGPDVARAFEGLVAITPARTSVSSLSEATSRDRLASARTCYDHLAGRLGVAITDALVRRRALLQQGTAFAMAHAASRVLSPMGIDVEAIVAGRRPPALGCLDWTERKPHVAGALGAALSDMLLRFGGIRKLRGTRAVVVTDPGVDFLDEHLGRLGFVAR